jgi:hypothetical protein
MMLWMTILRSCVISWVSQQTLTTIRMRMMKPLIQSPARNFSAFCSTYTTLLRLVHPTLCCRCALWLLSVAATGIEQDSPCCWHCCLSAVGLVQVLGYLAAVVSLLFCIIRRMFDAGVNC